MARPKKEDDFESAQDAFRKGDPRPLANWVLHYELNHEQREYVAQALCGEVERIDGRKVKPTTDRILDDYATQLWLNRMVKCFDLDGQGEDVLNDSEIARRLASKFGYQDSDSVRRLLTRRGKEIKNLLTDEEAPKNEKSGHEKK